MIYAIAVLCVLLLVQILAYCSYRRQIVDFCRQLAFIKNHETNKIVTQSLANRELVQLTTAMNELIQRYQQNVIDVENQDERLKRAITNVSHDIRTPLTSLDGYFQLLLDSTNDEERRRYYAIINERIASLSELLDQLFTYTKLQSSAYQLELDKVDLSRILSDTILSFYQDITAQQIEPEISIPDQACEVLGNEVALKRVFQNVIKNALAHGTRFFAVQLEPLQDEVILRFSNFYADPKGNLDVSQVFDRFYQADASRSAKTTGLGLSIAKELIERMDGSIAANYHAPTFTIAITMKRLRI